MIKYIMRSIPEPDGRRTGIKLDKETWEAIDWIAKKDGIKWSNWAKNVLNENPETNNVTGVLRAAAMGRILKELVRIQNNLDKSKEIEKLAREILGGKK